MTAIAVQTVLAISDVPTCRKGTIRKPYNCANILGLKNYQHFNFVARLLCTFQHIDYN